jgi:hypothetical protein
MTAAANGHPPGGAPAGDELRLLIREVLSDVMPVLRDRLTAASGMAAPPHTLPVPPATPVAAPAFATQPPGASAAPPTAPPTAPPAAPPTAIPAGILADPDAPPPDGRPVPPVHCSAAGTGQPRACVPDSCPPVGTKSAPTQALAGRHAPPAPAPVAAAPRVTSGAASRGTVRQVRLETDEDVRRFALEVMRLVGNPARRADLIAGRLRFTLARRVVDASRPEHRVDAGAVTERAVQAAARAGERLVLGPRAMLTPLARDRALALGVPIEKER